MNSRKKVGLDYWEVICDSSIFFHTVQEYELEIYDITIQQRSILFYAPLYRRHDIYHCFETIELKTTTGMLGYLLRSVRKPSRVLSILCVIALWYTFSHMIFQVEIKGEQQESRQLIAQTLDNLGLQVPFYSQDVAQLKATLKKTLEKDIAWLEIEKIGSKYCIRFTPKEFASLETLNNDELIAQCDGVVQRFDIEHGNKVKKVNDFVHAGDVLVSNLVDTTSNEYKETYVKGRVFGYTWRDVSVSMEANDLPKSFQYFDLLMEARREVSKDFKSDDKIDKENILQFSSDMGKIEMTVHYTLIKDITTP